MMEGVDRYLGVDGFPVIYKCDASVKIHCALFECVKTSRCATAVSSCCRIAATMYILCAGCGDPSNAVSHDDCEGTNYVASAGGNNKT